MATAKSKHKHAWRRVTPIWGYCTKDKCARRAKWGCSDFMEHPKEGPLEQRDPGRCDKHKPVKRKKP